MTIKPVPVCSMRDAVRLPLFAVARKEAADQHRPARRRDDGAELEGCRKPVFRRGHRSKIAETEHILASTFHHFGDGKPTARESEIVELVLKGKSFEAIGKRLGIATGTVRMHRKNIHMKLGISSQGEIVLAFRRLDTARLHPGRSRRELKISVVLRATNSPKGF